MLRAVIEEHLRGVDAVARDEHALGEAHIDGRSAELAADVDEFEKAGLTKEESSIVKAKRVKESPIQLECQYVTTVVLPGADWKSGSHLVIGRVVCIHVDENYVLPNGKLDILKLRPLARLGYADYTSVTDVWEMRPQSMMNNPIPGGYSYMSPESLKLEATHKDL